MARTTPTKREAKVETVEAPIMEAPEEQQPVVTERHNATEGDLMKHQLVLKEIMDHIEQQAAEIERLDVEITDEKEREKALGHLEAVAKGLRDAVAKVGTQDKKVGWVRAALEKHFSRLAAAKAKAKREADKKAAEAAKAAAAAEAAKAAAAKKAAK